MTSIILLIITIIMPNGVAHAQVKTGGPEATLLNCTNEVAPKVENELVNKFTTALYISVYCVTVQQRGTK